MKITAFCFALIALLASCNTNQSKAPRWIPLFNGENLDGWEVKIAGHPVGENYKNTFQVENGILVVNYDAYDHFDNKFGHLITQTAYSSYRLRVEYRIVGAQLKGGPVWGYRNNGIMIHSQSAESMELDQYFPTSIEVQLYGGTENDDRTNMNVCTPGTLIDIDGQTVYDHCTNSNSKVVNGDAWTVVEVLVNGDSLIQHLIDGKVVMEYTHPRLDPESDDYQRLYSPETGERLTNGHIAIQSESHRTEFRKIEILDLSKK